MSRRSPRLNNDESFSTTAPIKTEEGIIEQFDNTLYHKQQQRFKNEKNKKRPHGQKQQQQQQQQQQQPLPPTPPYSNPTNQNFIGHEDYLKQENSENSCQIWSPNPGSYNSSRRASTDSTSTLISAISEFSGCRSQKYSFSDNLQTNFSPSDTNSFASNSSNYKDAFEYINLRGHDFNNNNNNDNNDNNNAGSSFSRTDIDQEEDTQNPYNLRPRINIEKNGNNNLRKRVEKSINKNKHKNEVKGRSKGKGGGEGKGEDIDNEDDINNSNSLDNHNNCDDDDIDCNDNETSQVDDNNDDSINQQPVDDHSIRNIRDTLERIKITAKTIFGSINDKKRFMVLGFVTSIVILSYCFICQLSSINGRCIYWLVKDSDLSSEYTNYIGTDNDVRYDYSDSIVRAAVAEQVKSLCAAEIQKRIQPENNEMARYRRYILDDVVVEIIKNEIHKAVEEKLYIYSQDRLNKADYALSSGGAKIISPLTSPTYEMWPTQWYQRIIAALTGHGITRGKPPITALQPETHVGQCWPFAGQKGQLAVLLSRRVYVTAVTYDHVSKNVAMGVTSAPNEFEVWGFVDDIPEVIFNDPDRKKRQGPLLLKQADDVIQGESHESIFTNNNNNNYYYDDDDDGHSTVLSDDPSNSNDANGPENSNDDATDNPKNGDEKDLKLGSSPNHLFLGKFEYDINGHTIQTFEVKRYSKPIIAVLLKVNSNWDNPQYTCLYRFRVHGIRSNYQS